MISRSASRAPILIHQALHGYENGHRLIESSVRLPPDARATMLLLSDMSGPSMLDGFERYLTGYPLSEAQLYVFACTWYAPEMERPGCVWTHSLLIRFADLGEIDNLAALEESFRRPVVGDTDGYATDLVGNTRRRNPAAVFEEADSPITVLSALYETPHSAVLPARQSAAFADVVLKVWDQQWPRLRRSFSFCTGAIAPREVNGRAFDLQVTPIASTRLFTESEHMVVASGIGKTQPTEWLSLAAEDLARSRPSKLRAFLWTYGADVSNERGAFRPLVQTFLLAETTNRQTSVIEVIDQIATAFPQPTDAGRLKRWLLGDSKAAVPLFPAVLRWDVLRELLQSKSSAAFESDMIVGVTRSATATAGARGRVDFLESLLTSPLNSIGREVLYKLLLEEEVSELFSLLRQNAEAGPRIVEARPDVASSNDFWTLPNYRLERLFPVLRAQLQSQPEQWGAVIDAMLASDNDRFSVETMESAGLVAVDAVFRWVGRDGSQGDRLPTAWRKALQQRTGLAVDWLRNSVPTRSQLEFAATIVNPNANELVRSGITLWLQLVPSAAERRRELLDLRCFLLALAWNNPSGHPEAVVAEVFQPVLDDAERATNWFMIESHLSQGGSWLWGEWGRRERLVRALVDHFVRFRWPSLQLLRAIRDRQTFQEVVNYCEASEQGRSLLRDLRRTYPLLPKDSSRPFMNSFLEVKKRRRKH